MSNTLKFLFTVNLILTLFDFCFLFYSLYHGNQRAANISIVGAILGIICLILINGARLSEKTEG